MPSTTIQVNNGRPIDRTMPAILRGYINSNDWIYFCDNYDAKAVPSVPDNDDAIIAGGMFLCIVAGILSIAISSAREFNREPWESQSFPVGIPIGVFLVFGTCIGGTCLSGQLSSEKSERFFKDITKICTDVSKQQPCLTFHLKKRTLPGSVRDDDNTRVESLYIEVSLAETTGLVTTEIIPYDDPEMAYALASAVPNSLVFQTTAERMQELESIRHLLTEKEFAQKRESIIADI